MTEDVRPDALTAIPAPAEDTRPASAQLITALREKGYKAIGSQITRRKGHADTTFTLWSNGATELLLETFETDQGYTWCEMYRPLVTSTKLADTIAAIP